ncbi:cyclic nucleotide-binding domain protein (macronuclear) [Tetrahymena thermophila SB210]|uniref:Cyclic nucleotide-binding domain protein n=1 Tax=Tetrahymena thermophila (strain SB210) TaxID=312017 RepID=Q22G10_TETTS|nr:cyclic nucleotide-binding domain protein [Tetrahymena thermophila SB210]EAR84216.2 cyclic nucleotide-binding domain protein [Tetrahymena thermophila SB210]|eukprot:XP_001031879.2 cyclic nucleotide-binding domain protein [Tetrahymena thermophila SB210]
MSDKTYKPSSEEFFRKNSFLNLENLKNFNSYDHLLTLISSGTQKSIPEDLEQKAIRLLKSIKCNQENLTNFTAEQVEEYYFQLVKNFQLVEYKGPTIIDPQQTKNLYLVFFGEVTLYTQKHNEGMQDYSPERYKQLDQQTIKSFLNLNLQEEGEIIKNIAPSKDYSQVATTSQEEFLFKNFEVFKKLLPGNLFGEVKQIPELPKKYLAFISENAILAQIEKKDLDNIQKIYMKELYFKVNQLKKLLPNVNNKSIIQLSKDLVSRNYVKDQVIYSEGSESDCIYIIKEGQVTFVKNYNEIVKPTTDQMNQEGEEDENSHQILMKHKVLKNQIELSKMSGGSIFGEDEIFLGTLRNNTAKVSSINLDVYVLKKEQLFQVISQANSNSNQNCQNYLENMRRHSLKKQDFYEKRILINKKKIQNIVENQRKANSPHLQRGLSGIINEGLEQKSPKEAYSFFKTTSKVATTDNHQIKQYSQLSQNNRNLSYENQVKNNQADLSQNQKEQQNSQTDVLNQFEGITLNKQSVSKKQQNNIQNQMQRTQKINNQANQKQVSATDEIQQLVQTNQQFMKKTGQNVKKFGFDNPLFDEIAKNQIQRIRQINEDYLKMKDPKKYREKPMHQKNQIIQKRMSKILDLTIRKQQNNQNHQQDSKDGNQDDAGYKLKEVSSNIASPRIQDVQKIASLNNFISSPTQSISNINNSQTNTCSNLNKKSVNSQNGLLSSSQQIPVQLKFSLKSKFLQHSDSPTTRQIDQSDSPIQVNSLISSYRDSPMNRNQSDKKVGLTFNNFQQSLQRSEQQQVQNNLAPPQSKFSQEAKLQNEVESSLLKAEQNLRKLEDFKMNSNTIQNQNEVQKGLSKDQRTPEKRQYEEYQTQPFLRKVSTKNISEEKQQQNYILSQKQKQNLQIKIPKNDYCDVLQEDLTTVKSNQTVYYLNHCSKNRHLVRNSSQQFQSQDFQSNKHPFTTVSTPSNQLNQKLSYNQFQDTSLSYNNTPFHIPKSQSFGKKNLQLDTQEESKNYFEKRYQDDTFSQVFQISQTQFNQNSKVSLADNNSIDQLNISNNNQQNLKQPYINNSKSMNQIFKQKNQQLKNNYFQKQNNMFLLNSPQNHLIFYKNNQNVQSQSQIFQNQQRFLFKNGGHFSHRVDSSLVQQIQSPKGKQQIQNEIVNFHTLNKKNQNKIPFQNQFSQLQNQKNSLVNQNTFQIQPPNSPLSNEKQALYKIVNNLN